MDKNALQRIRSSGRTGDSLVYPGQTATGRPLRSSTTLIRDPAGNTVGAFCINYDMADLLTTRGILDGMCQPPPCGGQSSPAPVETFANNPEQTFDSILQAAVGAVGK